MVPRKCGMAFRTKGDERRRILCYLVLQHWRPDLDLSNTPAHEEFLDGFVTRHCRLTCDLKLMALTLGTAP
jgi:hypothetical protein